MQNQPIVGVWQVNIKVEGMAEAFAGLYTFFADGNFLDVNSLQETNPGIWRGNGNNYEVTFWGFVVDAKGQYNAQGKVRAAIQLDDSNHLTAHGVTDMFAPNGAPIEHEFSGPFIFTGTRVEAETL